MRKELGVLIVEKESEIGVQLFDSNNGVVTAFNNLKGRIGDPPSRATLLWLNFGEVKTDVVTSTKHLPEVESPETQPDGFVLGEGPVTFPK